MKTSTRLTLLLLVALLGVAGCGERTVSDRAEGGVDSVLTPDSEVFGATIYLYKGDRVTTEIRADKIVRFETIDSTMGYQLNVDFFDSVGHVTSNLVGDSGVIREKVNQMEVYGEVVVLTDDSTRLDTDYLRWNPDKGKIESEAYVVFTRGDDVMTGWGMEADPDLGRLRIKSQVSGTVSKDKVLDEK